MGDLLGLCRGNPGAQTRGGACRIEALVFGDHAGAMTGGVLCAVLIRRSKKTVKSRLRFDLPQMDPSGKNPRMEAPGF